MPNRPLSERMRLDGHRPDFREIAALEAEHARLTGIVQAQVAEINHHMDENARLRKVYEAATALVDLWRRYGQQPEGDDSDANEVKALITAVREARESTTTRTQGGP